MQVKIRCWDYDEYFGDLKNAELSINGHNVDINDVESISFNSNRGYDTHYINGTLILPDSKFDFKLEEKGVFRTRYDGNLKGFFEVHVRSLNCTYRIAVHEISNISFIKEHI